MRRESMLRMPDEELEAYARLLGTTARAYAGKEDKADHIARRRERAARVEALGVELEVPVKRMHDKRVTDLINGEPRTDERMDEAFALLLGEEQLAELYAAATDEDGTVDVTALSLAYSRILESPELKNW